jgi:hypothetical protein
LVARYEYPMLGFFTFDPNPFGATDGQQVNCPGTDKFRSDLLSRIRCGSRASPTVLRLERGLRTQAN